MSRTFAYLRVSTVDQTTDNQLHEIEAAGFAAQPRRIVAETISGSVAAKERKGFARLLDRLEDPSYAGIWVTRRSGGAV